MRGEYEEIVLPFLIAHKEHFRFDIGLYILHFLHWICNTRFIIVQVKNALISSATNEQQAL